MAWLFALGILLPAYKNIGFDGSAHTSEETKGLQWLCHKGLFELLRFLP